MRDANEWPMANDAIKATASRPLIATALPNERPRTTFF
jgi:hypothetical protein